MVALVKGQSDRRDICSKGLACRCLGTQAGQSHVDSNRYEMQQQCQLARIPTVQVISKQ